MIKRYPCVKIPCGLAAGFFTSLRDILSVAKKSRTKEMLRRSGNVSYLAGIICIGNRENCYTMNHICHCCCLVCPYFSGTHRKDGNE
jgi:hypothetical protein